MREFFLSRVEHLTARERDFVADLRYQQFAPSPKQLAWLNRILNYTTAPRRGPREPL